MHDPADRDQSAAAGRWLGGRLLVATPVIDEPTFARTVVLLLEHDAGGALGVVLNRASDVAVTTILPGWEPLVTAPDVVFVGGPVAQDNALALVRLEPGTAPLGVRPVAANLALVDLDIPPDLVAGALHRMRVFAGYAGWGPGQLEDELASGAWFVVDVRLADVFCDDPDVLWRQVLRRQPPPLSLVATFPTDPSLN